MRLTVEFSGGLELLFDGQKKIRIDDPDQQALTLRNLLSLLAKNYIKERPELFVQGETM